MKKRAPLKDPRYVLLPMGIPYTAFAGDKFEQYCRIDAARAD
jgi:hypothetical protein